MADAHDDKGGGGEGGGGNGFLDVLFWLVLVLVAFYVLKYFFLGIGIDFSSTSTPSLAGVFSYVFDKIQVFSVFLCLLFFAAILYTRLKLSEVLKSHGGHGSHGHADNGHGHGNLGSHDTHGNNNHGPDVTHQGDDSHHSRATSPGQNVQTHQTTQVSHNNNASQTASRENMVPVVFHKETYTPPLQIQSHGPNKRWQSIEERIASSDPNSWKFAIVDADIILDEMLDRMGFEGKGIAEKLKQANKADFATLDNAWKAHKIRNQIAHEGSNFKLSKSAAEDAIKNYQKVFEEFYFI